MSNYLVEFDRLFLESNELPEAERASFIEAEIHNLFPVLTRVNALKQLTRALYHRFTNSEDRTRTLEQVILEHDRQEIELAGDDAESLGSCDSEDDEDDEDEYDYDDGFCVADDDEMLNSYVKFRG